ncbi:MAG: patatin-like phospholipase family protein [Candidatus Omnitrophota bacterium]
MSKKKIALVLGGGAARGLAHIGVIKILKRENIIIDLIVGTSIGSLIGASYALDLPLVEVEKKANKLKWQDLLDLTVPVMGINKGERLEQVIRKSLHDKDFKDLKIPLAVVALDIEKGEEVIFQSGQLSKAIRASCSIVGIFNPVRIGGRLLVDGGYKRPVPVEIAKNLEADFIIAVDIGFYIMKGRITNVAQVIFQALEIQGQELDRYESSQADITISPNLQEFDQMSFNHAREIIKRGEIAAESAMPEIKRQLRDKPWKGVWGDG